MDERETEIIHVATQIPADLPEPYVAGHMFFRFDPGFRTELDDVRQAWGHVAVPLNLELLHDHERFQFEVAYTQDRRLRALAEQLAHRWGLDADGVVDAVATGRAVNYPYFRIQTDLDDEGTGLVYTQVRVYSEYVWAKLLPGFHQVKPALSPPTPRRFPDSRLRHRLRGMNSQVAARALALYFLTRTGSRPRSTGGRRTAAEADALWREYTRPDRQKGDRWSRAQKRLLFHVATRRADPVSRLMAAQQARGLSDPDWALLLGVELSGPDGMPFPDTWHGTRSAVAPSRAFWEGVYAALPELKDDLAFDLWARGAR